MKFLLRTAANLLLVVGATTSFAQGLSLSEAIELASHDAPALVANAEQEEAARLSAEGAGKLPSPKLILGIDNMPVDGPDQYSLSADFMTMQRIGLMQDFPTRAKRDARVASAQGRVSVAQAQSRVTRLDTTVQIAKAWLARDSAERQLAQIDTLVAENLVFDAAVKARRLGGQGVATEGVAAREERALIDERREELLARRAQAIAVMGQFLGDSVASRPLSGEMPDWSIERELVLHGVQQHPEFALLDARGQMLNAEVAEARADKRSDWSMEVAYQKRGPQYSNMMSVQFTVDLPVFSRSRLNPQIEAGQAELRALDASREADVREHVQMLTAELADYHRLSSAVNRQRDVLVPLAEEKVALAMVDWRNSRISVMDVIAVRRARIDAGLKLIELEGQRRQIAASLHYTYAEHDGAQP